MSKKEPVIESRPEKFKRIALELSEMYTKKNADYGNSFGETFADVGIISAYTRISDKFNRFKHAVISGDKLNYESLGNTILDLGCYCIMTLIELQEELPVPVKQKGDITDMFKNCTPMSPLYRMDIIEIHKRKNCEEGTGKY